MTTVSNPFGSPVVHYNKSGSTIQEYSISNGDRFVINCPSSDTHIIVSDGSMFPSPSDGFELPSLADIGDMVTIWLAGSYSVNVFAPPGGDISGYSEIILSSNPSATTFIKYSNTSWANGAR